MSMDSARLKLLKKISRRAFWLMALVSTLALGGIDSQTWPIVVLCFAVTAATLGAYLVFLRLAQSQAQRELKDVLARSPGDPGRLPIILFLRSFDIARTSLRGRALSALFVMMNATGGSASTAPFYAEEELDDAVGSHGVFLAIGNKYASYGSAKLVVDDKGWKQTFETLADAATLIFMMPGPSESVLWEASQILSSRESLKKTAFIMPRETPESGSLFALKRSVSREANAWAEFADMARRDLQLPVPYYNNEGCCFTIQPDDHACDTLDLEAFTGALAKFLASSRPSSGAEFDIAQIFAHAK